VLTPGTIKATAFGLAAVMAAVSPLLQGQARNNKPRLVGFPGWPTHYEGRSLTPLPMTDREQAFARGFPGLVGRFSDGKREIIVRFVTEPTRRLHPAADCLRGAGYSVAPRPARREAGAALMSCVAATRHGESLEVCETIRSEARQWPDASSWYWSAMLGGDKGPWWSTVVAEPRPANE
jgi:hypothetical protein